MKRIDTAKKLGAPIELCIQCLREFIGPDGIDVRTLDGKSIEEALAGLLTGDKRTCCSIRCAIAYGDARGGRGVVLSDRRSDGDLLGGRGETGAWSFTTAGETAKRAEEVRDEADAM